MHIDIRHIQKAIALAGLSAVLSPGSWAQTEVKPPTSTRPQSPPAQTQGSPNVVRQGGPTQGAPTQGAPSGGVAGGAPGGTPPTGGVPQSGAPVRFLGPPVTIFDQVQQAAQ